MRIFISIFFISVTSIVFLSILSLFCLRSRISILIIRYGPTLKSSWIRIWIRIEIRILWRPSFIYVIIIYPSSLSLPLFCFTLTWLLNSYLRVFAPLPQFVFSRLRRHSQKVINILMRISFLFFHYTTPHITRSSISRYILELIFWYRKLSQLIFNLVFIKGQLAARHKGTNPFLVISNIVLSMIIFPRYQ